MDDGLLDRLSKRMERDLAIERKRERNAMEELGPHWRHRLQRVRQERLEAEALMRTRRNWFQRDPLEVKSDTRH